MPSNETPDQRHDRRSAIRAISRLSTALDSSEVLSKDSGAAVLADRVAQLRQKLEGEELEVLEEQVRKYEEAVGVPLPAPHSHVALCRLNPSTNQLLRLSASMTKTS